MTIEEILNSENSAESKIAALKEKTIVVPVWSGRFGLVQQFDPTKHPVMNKQKYPDIVTDEGIEYVTRVTCDLQRLATKRMTELVTGIPPKGFTRRTTTDRNRLPHTLRAYTTATALTA